MEQNAYITISVSIRGEEISMSIKNNCTVDEFLKQLATDLPSIVPANPVLVFRNTELKAFTKQVRMAIQNGLKLEVKEKYWTTLGYDSRTRRLSIGESENNPPLFLGVKKECIMCKTNEPEEETKATATLFEDYPV